MHASDPSANKTRVLLVEDDPQVRDFMAEALRFLRFHVEVAEDGLVALEHLAAAHFDVVLTDHRMPRLGGPGLVRALRTRRYPGRVFVLSGVLDEAERDAYAALGVDGIALKPLPIAELQGMLRGWGHARAARA
jgi:CheY-like chemotaxis protein